ncbi:hypothetical protein [Thermomonas sp.]|uniref:hypothetical protein n=1 Tax=Thermomonas sp. TaxID=1971895 RepID=UPI002488AC7F|nr:hypothetical protein [Thermomonas sp.]MDI1251851.1 hypothetical protein [Thermomonas sp.]
MNEDRMQIGEAELRMALLGLRQDIEPGHDLWPGIAARLQVLPQQPIHVARKPRVGWLWPVATAASLLLAVGMAWQFKPGQPEAATGPAQSSRPASSATLVQREADSMTAHYQAALRELAPQPVPASWQPGLDTLDRGAIEIRSAMQHDPNSRLLLQRLRDTYTRRLALARRALYA